MRTASLRVACLGVLLLASSARAGEGAPAVLEKAVQAFWSAGEAERAKAIDALLALEPKTEDLEPLLKKGRKHGAGAPGAWTVAEVRGSDGIQRPYHVYVPKAYDPSAKIPVLFNLHGGVSTPTLYPSEIVEEERRGMWFEEAAAGEFILVFPLGQKGAEWWSPVGAGNVLAILSALKREYNVDENRVYVAGFSDGGSGAYFFGLNFTTPFAGFVALNGHVTVAGMGRLPVYLPNLSNKPLYAVNTGKDRLYPAKDYGPLVDAMREAGARLTYRVYDDVGHAPAYWPDEQPRLMEFLRTTQRVPLPDRLTWEASDPRTARCHWVRIDEVGGVGDNAAELAKDFNPVLTSGRVMLGITINPEFPGPGVSVLTVAEGSCLARRMGLREGDVIVEADGKPIGSLADLRAILDAKKPGDAVSVSARRGEETVKMEGTFDPPESHPAFERTGTAARISVAREGNRVDVRVRNVAVYTLFLSRDQFDFGKPVEVVTNGKPGWNAPVPPDPRFLLEQAAADDDRSMLFAAKITIDLRRPGK